MNALLVTAGFIVLRDVLQERGERFYASALLAAAIPAGGLYLICIAETVANSTMAVQGDHTPFPPVLSHLYDVLEFFASLIQYFSLSFAARTSSESACASQPLAKSRSIAAVLG